MGILHKAKKRILFKALQKASHGQLIQELVERHIDFSEGRKVFVETGCGVSTLALAESGREGKAVIYSCDINSEKADELKAMSGGAVDEVNFLIGSSLDSLADIAEKHQSVDFLFLDSAASAMYTFQEFQVMEKCLKPGSVLLVDNAAIPGETRLLSPVRKGKILVPYLLASPFWEVTGYPEAGDSMVAAVLRSAPDYADPSFEDPDYIDNWRTLFHKELD